MIGSLFSNAAIVRSMLDFEAALARAEARLGIIPDTAARAITTASAGDFDADSLSREAAQAGTLAIPLIKALTERVRATDPDSARFVHWGASSQDASDTALVLALKRAQPILAGDAARLESSLRRLSDEYASAAMLGRTLLQAAPPITFGLKAAAWFGAVSRGADRVALAFDEALILQFGGASGTLAALGSHGLAVSAALAEGLGLRVPEAPWHSHRDRLAALAAACGVLTGTLGKIARDISLLMQEEVGEAAEQGGGSSTMPHKRNPTGCAIAIAAATRAPGLVASLLFGMMQEHERGIGGWQAEYPAIAGLMECAGSALAAMADAMESLRVSPDRMRANIDATRGTVFTERVMMIAGAALGRDVAHKLLAGAARRSIEEGRPLRDVLGGIPEIANLLTPEQLREIDRPECYLGVAEALRRRLLE